MPARNVFRLLSPRLQQLQRDIRNVGVDALLEFWSEIDQQHTPLIEPGTEGDFLVTFLWRDNGSTGSVAVIQDWGADGIREHQMTHLPNTDVWYLTRSMRSDTRTTYQLSPSPSEDPNEPAPYQLDPLSPRTFTAYLSENGANIHFSLLELPDTPVLPWRQTGWVKPGKVQLHTPFADQRRLWVYTPPIHSDATLSILTILDGRLYKDLLKLPEMLDYLIDQGKIPPVAALLVDNPDRSELLCRSEFADYMTNAVMPWLRATYPVTSDPHQTIVLGSSFGGLAAAFLAYKQPGTWGKVFSQSGWFRWHPEGDPEHHWLARQLITSPRVPIRFWLQVGNLETARMLDGGPSQLEANRRFRDALHGKGYEVSYWEYSGGHDASSLEFPLARALTEILG